jgi:hypothetical protein
MENFMLYYICNKSKLNFQLAHLFPITKFSEIDKTILLMKQINDVPLNKTQKKLSYDFIQFSTSQEEQVPIEWPIILTHFGDSIKKSSDNLVMNFLMWLSCCKQIIPWLSSKMELHNTPQMMGSISNNILKYPKDYLVYKEDLQITEKSRKQYCHLMVAISEEKLAYRTILQIARDFGTDLMIMLRIILLSEIEKTFNFKILMTLIELEYFDFLADYLMVLRNYSDEELDKINKLNEDKKSIDRLICVMIPEYVDEKKFLSRIKSFNVKNRKELIEELIKF